MSFGVTLQFASTFKETICRGRRGGYKIFMGKKRGAEVIQLIKVEVAWVHSKEKNVNELKNRLEIGNLVI